MPPTPTTTVEETTLNSYVCDRCGYKYSKQFDYPPFLCYRCMRYMAKQTWKMVHTIQPPISRPESIGEV